MKKKRCDVLLVDGAICKNINEAVLLIMAGKVRTHKDHLVTKPSELIAINANFIIERPMPYVSRGALKLEKSLKKHLNTLSDFICMDIGASTGGFTDLMLQHGAKKVYAVDSGYGQLHSKLRNDKRVICLERTNARYLSEKQISEKQDIMTCDVSFISVKKILPATIPLLKDSAWVFILVKPQFEAKRNEVPKGGVVTNIAVQKRVVSEINDFMQDKLNWINIEVSPSPIKGPKGNQEFICVFRKKKELE